MIRLSIHKANGIEKVKGLIGKKNPEAILIQTRFGIHTFGLKFPIDIAVIDRTDAVQITKYSLKPNSIFLWRPKYDRILELPAGTLKEKGIKKGTVLTLNLKS